MEVTLFLFIIPQAQRWCKEIKRLEVDRPVWCLWLMSLAVTVPVRMVMFQFASRLDGCALRNFYKFKTCINSPISQCDRKWGRFSDMIGIVVFSPPKDQRVATTKNTQTNTSRFVRIKHQVHHVLGIHRWQLENNAMAKADRRRHWFAILHATCARNRQFAFPVEIIEMSRVVSQQSQFVRIGLK